MAFAKKGSNFNKNEYFNFLKSIGYIAEDQGDFEIETANVDKEISSIAGPQLVVPIMNSRYALNAANARFQSLYDSLYGTDVIESEESASERYDPERGMEVIKYTKKFLDDHFELVNSSWKQVNKIEINDTGLNFITYNGNTKLKNDNKFIVIIIIFQSLKK